MKFLKDWRVIPVVVVIAAFTATYFYYHSKYAIKLSYGDVLEEVAVPDRTGNPQSVYGIKDKLVLINFWASWCGPCIKEMPDLQELYTQYHDTEFTNGNGFEIYNYSLDKDTAKWKQAVERLGVNWPYQVNDKEGFKSPLAVKLNIVAIPTNVLIDRNHTIIGVDLDPRQLKKTLEGFRK